MRLNDEDLARELKKVHDVLKKVDQHFHHKDQMNAALHMASEVRSTPLAAAVKVANATIYDIIAEAEGHNQARYSEE